VCVLAVDPKAFHDCSSTPFCRAHLGVRPATEHVPRARGPVGWEDGAAIVPLEGGGCSLKIHALASLAWRVRVSCQGDRFHAADLALPRLTRLARRDVHAVAPEEGASGRAHDVRLRAPGLNADLAVHLDQVGEAPRIDIIPVALPESGPALSVNAQGLMRAQAPVGADVTFPHAEGPVYGLPARGGPLALERRAHSTEPGAAARAAYRLYNVDVFEYEATSTRGLYGSVPVLHATSARGDVASALWLSGAETYVDLWATPQGGSAAHFLSEEGAVDLVVWCAPDLAGAVHRLVALTGPPPLPPLWALGFHVSHWGIHGVEDARAMHANADRFGVPLDALWMDIDHTDAKRYFTWDSRLWPNGSATAFQGELAARGRRAVLIADPHVRAEERNPIYSQASARGLLVNASGAGEPFLGKCWPGTSAWVDYVNPEARSFWADLYTHPPPSAERTAMAHSWNDMNEPSVFDAPDVTMSKDAVHTHVDAATGERMAVRHGLVHNIYGVLMAGATAEGMRARGAGADEGMSNTPARGSGSSAGGDAPDADPAADGGSSAHGSEASELSHATRLRDPTQDAGRPFVLSRAFFAGSQQHGAVWTGDNSASWEHLGASMPMLLALGLGGLGFAGADVGGFGGGDPDAELLVRWYEAGAAQPFFRSHAHSASRRREPWLLPRPVRKLLRRLVQWRQEIAPYLYTAFRQAAAGLTGPGGMPCIPPEGDLGGDVGEGCLLLPPMRPLAMHYPTDTRCTGRDDHFLLGKDLLARPVTAPGERVAHVCLPTAGHVRHSSSAVGESGTGQTPPGAADSWYDAESMQLARPHHGWVRVDAPLGRLPLLQRGGSVVPRRWHPRRAASLTALDPITLHIAAAPDGTASGSIFLDAGDGAGCGITGVWQARGLGQSAAPWILDFAAYGEGPGCGCALHHPSMSEEGVVVERIVIATAATVPGRHLWTSRSQSCPADLSVTYDSGMDAEDGAPHFRWTRSQHLHRERKRGDRGERSDECVTQPLVVDGLRLPLTLAASAASGRANAAAAGNGSSSPRGGHSRSRACLRWQVTLHYAPSVATNDANGNDMNGSADDDLEDDV